MSSSPDASAQPEGRVLARPGHAGPHLHREHFELADEIAVRPLARRRSRLLAMLVDLTLVAVLSGLLSSLRVLFTSLIALLLYWGLGRLGLVRSTALRATAAALTFGTLLTLAFAFLPDVAEHDDDEEAEERAEEAGDEALEAQVAEALAQVNAAARPDGGAQELAALRAGTARLTARVETLEKELEEAKKERGILHFVKASAHDLGFGIGWSYVYFIGFLTLWNGLTPGKRLFGIRAVRVDGKPFSLWRAWERFHGYAASMLTGLLGFAQILWDPNRQCLHDKVAETVVVCD